MIDASASMIAFIANDGGVEVEGGGLVPWWSFSKTVLAAAALQLVALGKGELDAPFRGHPFTLRQLLQHRAGVTNYGARSDYRKAVERNDRPWVVTELLDRVDASRLEFPPGEGWRYSNIGYLYVREWIERVTGERLDDALQELLFDRIGLTSVKLATTPADIEGLTGVRRGYNPGWVYPGLLVGELKDAARFLHVLVRGDVLPPQLLDEMLRRVQLSTEPIPLRPWQTAGYGLGLMMGKLGMAGEAVGHSGSGPDSACAVYHYPDRNCTIAALVPGKDEANAEQHVSSLAAISNERRN